MIHKTSMFYDPCFSGPPQKTPPRIFPPRVQNLAIFGTPPGPPLFWGFDPGPPMILDPRPS